MFLAAFLVQPDRPSGAAGSFDPLLSFVAYSRAVGSSSATYRGTEHDEDVFLI